MFFHHFLLPGMDDGKDLFRILLTKKFQRIQSLTEAGKSHRNHRYTLKHRRILRKLPDTILQLQSVVYPLAQNDLSIHGNPGIIQLLHLFQCLPCKTIVKHFTTKFRIHRLKRNIDRFQMVTDDPFYIMITHIGQCHIISLQKGKSGIVILKIKGISHPRRHLINKAEDTVVGTGPVIIHKPIFKLYSQIFLVLFLHFQLPDFPVSLLDLQHHVFFIHQITVIKYIFNRLSIHGNQGISLLDFQFHGDTSLLHLGNNMFFLFFHLFDSIKSRLIALPFITTFTWPHYSHYSYYTNFSVK